MKWIKKGQIFIPDNQFGWVNSHGMLPVADYINGDFYRIYFSGRDVSNISRIGYIVVDLKDPLKILELSKDPIIDIGELGSYDDNGVSPTCIVTHEGKKYLYIMGWNARSRVRAAEVSGLAISCDNGTTFKRQSKAPILDRTDKEPYTILVVSCILIENGIWRMWYDSADYWINENLPRYNIKYAESNDGINWRREGTVSVNYNSKEESRISRASVIKEDGIFKMWYCYAVDTGGYKIGYGESVDGYEFKRMDEKSGIELSDTGWDSEMICYPNVFKHKEEIYMLYCGNGYGKTGFGIALLDRR